MKKYIVLILIICCILVIILIAKVLFLTQEGKKIIIYLDKVNSIIYKVAQTRNATSTSEWGMDDVNEALRISNNSIKEIVALETPKECTEFKKLCIDYLNYLIEFHKKRIDIKNPSLFEPEAGNSMKMQSLIEEQIVKENFRILHKIGGLKVFIYRLTHKKR